MGPIHLCGIALLILVCLGLQVQVSCQQTCEMTCPASSSTEVWMSGLGILEIAGPTTARIGWNSDKFQEAPSRYIVQFRPSGMENFTSTNETIENDLTLTDLLPSTQYDVEVCRVEDNVSRSDNCGGCRYCLMTAAGAVPGRPTGITTRSPSPEDLVVEWIDSSATRERGISNYSVSCAITASQDPPIIMVSDDLPISFLMLTPNTSYTCLVVAVNIFGPSMPAMVTGSTIPRTTVPGALLVSINDTVSYIHVVDGGSTTPPLVLFTSTDTITGMDYHFQDSTLYFTTSTAGTGSLRRLEMEATDSDGRITLVAQGLPITMVTASAGVSYSHVAVEWVNNDVFYVELAQPNQNRIMRLTLVSEGPNLGPYCVAELSDPITNIAVDPVHGYLYWSTNERLLRITLSAVRTSSESCPVSLTEPAQLLASLPSLLTFTIEQGERIYFLGDFNCTTVDPPETVRSVVSTSLTGSGGSSFAFAVGNSQLIESFTETVVLDISTSMNILAAFLSTVDTPVCPLTRTLGISTSLELGSPPDRIDLMRMYRSAKQPLPAPPGPPISVRISTTNRAAVLTWRAPQFIGTSFSADAFDEWTYIISYCTQSQIYLENSTTALTLSLVGLTPSTNYFVLLTARGTGGTESIPDQLVFRTKANDFDSAQLLVAHESGVQRSALNGGNVMDIGGAESSESNAVAHDSFTNSLYWTIEGGQGNVFLNNEELPLDEATALYTIRDNPFALEYDWLSQRLFWVEDGERPQDSRREFVALLEAPNEAPMVLNEVSRVEGTAMDAFNGVLFWTDGANIRMQTLSGIPLGVCHRPLLEATSLAVDVQRTRLYWLSSSDRPGVPLTVSQMEYDSTSCHINSIVEQELSQVTFSSSSTILAYGSNTLFISNRGSDVVYTVSSELGSARENQVLATGSVQFSGNTPSNLEDIRDIVVASRALQPLPGTINMNQRRLENLRPSPPPFAPEQGDASTTTDIVIEWFPSSSLTSIPQSPFFYVVEYSLNRSGNVVTDSTITMENCITLSNQQASTTVTASVSTYSLWARSGPSPIGTFVSLPDRPGQVREVRIFTFRPNTDPSVVTGLVIWNGLDIVDRYQVDVAENGVLLPNLYRSQFPDTSYVILERDVFSNGDVNYLEIGSTYSVQVTAINSAGAGIASEEVIFTTNCSDYPQQVLTVGASGEQFLGDSLEINQNLEISEPGPVVVDTIGRTAYWYSPSMNLIYSRSLNNGAQKVFLPLPATRVLLSLAFDWIGECLYMLRQETATGRLELYRVLIYDTNILFNVFPDLVETVPSNSTFQLIMNPFTGFVYWTQTSSGNGPTSLHQLDLRQLEATSSSMLSPLSQGRRKRRSLRRLRRQALTSFSLTPALTQDPSTGDLLVCDTASGDILRCSLPGMVCSVEVERAALRTSDNMVVAGDAGLPATSLALNEQRLYWARADSPGLYAVELARDTLIVVSETAVVSSVNTLSPGQQIIPANQDCLSPLFLNNRPALRDEEVITNTSIFVAWEVTVPLLEICRNVVFSIPAFTYLLEYRLNANAVQPLFSMFTRRTCFDFEDLMPFTWYFIDIAVTNEFTHIDFVGQPFHLPVINRTRPGVPMPPTGLTAIVTGTASIRLMWDLPTQERLLGDMTLTRYFVFFDNGTEETLNPNLTLTRSPLLTQGEINVAEVIINNGAMNSSSESIEIPLWALVPAPTVTDFTNKSFNINITLPNGERYQDIQSVARLYCNSQQARLIPSGRCSCPFDESIMAENDFVAVDNLPFTAALNITNLIPFTEYCVQGVGFYTTETTAGIGQVRRTGSGVPGAPNTTLMRSILSWTEPMTNGADIFEYFLTLSQPGTTSDPFNISAGRAMQFDLENNRLAVGVTYDVVVTATNSIGRGLPSNITKFTRGGSLLTLPEIAGISVAGAAIISIIAIIIIIICFVQCRSSKRELRSLSYMYGPDHELSNLRDAYRNAQSSNPHYTWTFEDYVCTDEELSLLNKFPRNNLKLENFIDRGEFGEVFQGTATDILGVATGPTPVAVKTLRKGATPEEQTKFLSEAALMANFNHPNIVKVLGVCVDNDPVYIIMELMPGGDLLKFLREAKMDHGPTLLTLTEQIQVAVDVAQGCHYLEQQHFIHRDIAARNCLVSSKGSERVVKIGDFGLAKDLYSSDYYQVEGQRKLPVRWMAPEALLQGKFTVESDIWSYGVLLWEIMTLGNQPYPGRINQEVLQFVTGGGRLDRPDKCPSKLYHLMQGCWKRFTSDRPHFEAILNTLNSYMDRLKRPDSVYYSDSETDDEGENNVQRQGSGKQRTPTRTPSIREGILNLARSGSMKLRNSFRRHNSLHKREEHGTNSQEDNGSAFRERGPF